jgi:hypothetical protein
VTPVDHVAESDKADKNERSEYSEPSSSEQKWLEQRMGATGLEPATSGVTGRSWWFRADRESAGITGESGASVRGLHSLSATQIGEDG